MSSYLQIEANRRNALKSTGPKASIVMKRPFGARAGRLLCALEKLNYEAFW